MTQERVIIFDTTLRDGEQSPGYFYVTPHLLRGLQPMEGMPR